MSSLLLIISRDIDHLGYFIVLRYSHLLERSHFSELLASCAGPLSWQGAICKGRCDFVSPGSVSPGSVSPGSALYPLKATSYLFSGRALLGAARGNERFPWETFYGETR